MENIKNFIKKYKQSFLIIIAVILIYFISRMVYDIRENFTEHLTNEEQELEQLLTKSEHGPITKFVNKKIYIKYEKALLTEEGKTETLYIALSKIDDCNNLKKTAGECNNNVAILQKEKNKFSEFILTPKLGETRYKLVSILDNIYPINPVMSQQLNLTEQSDKLCFYDGLGDNVYFEFELTNIGKFKIKYRKSISTKNKMDKYEYYYVGMCVGKDSNCIQSGNQLTRLCLFKNPQYALNFDIELA